MVRLLLVDDHQLVRDGVRSHLERYQEYKIVAEASDGQEALQILETEAIDIILMDINMTGMDGISCTKEIRKRFPNSKVLALTMLNEPQYIKQMLAAGAAGYLLKNCQAEELIIAINSIINNDTYYSPHVTQIVMSSMSKNTAKASTPVRNIPLTDREIDVLKLILKEYSNKEIAEELFISPRTVDAHKRNLLEKTGSKNIAGLVIYSINNSLVTDL